ncbi:DUF998 domain-containing protein [Nocardioides sp. cx-173]|uniref:DUF998 domain-containing protein n=1 Tax=Nocardioides sp. cx-173 TaxID=2898796 RepID=UPI001E5B3F02|nr:DUF998 domain-containing protein [Nocardioides sp. cx-173]MCD4523522.1 DUF998 domain-containing protein [Nocardioides sp. cx-173]UGB42140.1 DUF998 domain-containing protein [Nocardioides sp. cx-173]
MTPRPRPLRPAALGVGAGLLYSNFVLDWVRRGPESLSHAVSELAAPGEPLAWVYRGGEVASAALVLPLLPSVRAALPPGPGREVVTAATALFALAATVAAVVPTPCGPGEGHEKVDRRPRSDLHDRASIAADAALYTGVVATWASTRRRGPRWLHRAARRVAWVGAGTSAAYLRARPSADLRLVAGVSQRLDIVTVSAWLCCLGVLAARAVPREAPHEAVPAVSHLVTGRRT